MKKKFLAILLAVALVLPLCPVISLPVFAAEVTSGTTGACTWTLDGTVLTISGSGAMANYSSYPTLPWGKSITEVVIEDGVTKIGSWAFYDCNSLTSITIPDSVTSIGSSAFRICKVLTSITIPDSVKSIGPYAFYCCYSLTSVTIPDSVTSIGDYAFLGCDSLTSITIGDSVTSIGEWAFADCDSLTSITIPGSVTSIGECPFNGCNLLKSIEVSFENTAYYSVSNCIIKTESKELIQGCNTSVIPSDGSVTSIGDHAFSDCDSFTSVTIPDSVTSIGPSAFYDCDSLTSVTIPDSVTSIGDNAFLYCNALTSITIGDSVTSIGKGAFSWCSSLTSITIGDSVTSIGFEAFYNCSRLTSITIPDSVTSIGNDAFQSCPRLSNVWYSGDRSAVANITIGINNGYLTSATWHYIDSACDEDCNACGEVNSYAHFFDNVCDAICNKCSKERTVPDHVYSGICDATCNGCGNIREVPDHTYSNKADDTCNECGYKRKLSYDAYGTTGSCYWYVEGTRLTIFGSGAMADYDVRNPSPWGTSVTEVVIEDGVTAIGADTFSYNTSLTNLVLPKSVTSIGIYAFDGCSTLTDIWYEGTEEDKASLTIGGSNAALTSATWHYNVCKAEDHVHSNACDTTCDVCGFTRTVPDHIYDNNCDTTCNECGFVRVTLHTPVNGVCTECGQKAVVPVSAQLVLDKYIGVKFYFNKTDVDEDFTFLVTLPGRDEPLAEGAFSDLIEDGKYYVLSFNGIGLSDFNTEFTLSGKTLWDPNAGRYNSVYKLATIGANHYTDGSKADKLFKSIVDLGKAAVGEETEYDLTFKAETPASSGQGPEEGAALRFTGKNLLMNDTIALRLYGEADTAEAVAGMKVIFNNKYNVTRMCDISTPVYNEVKGKYTFTVDIFFSTSTMEEAITITVNDSEGLRCLELNDRIDWIAQTILAKQPGNTLAKQILIYIQSINDFVRREDAVITPSKPGTETELGGEVEV